MVNVPLPHPLPHPLSQAQSPQYKIAPEAVSKQPIRPLA
jgi:hypothetical protein